MNELTSELIGSLSPQKRRLLEQLLSQRSAGTTSGSGAVPPLEPQSVGAAKVLSYAQERMWSLARKEESVASYNVPLALRLRGSLDLPALEEAFRRIVQRHEVLRTGFPAEREKPYPMVKEDVEVFIETIDLQHLSPAEAETEADKRAAVLAARIIDVARPPLLRAQLFRLGSEDHIFFLVFHHLIFDGWSVGVFLAELQSWYEAIISGEADPLPSLRVQFTDYAHWERKLLTEARLKTLVDYWKLRLEGALPELPLASEMPGSGPDSAARTGALTVEIEGEVYNELAAFCRAHGFTPFIVLLAAFEIALARYCNVDDLVIGTQNANRNHPALEPLIGLFVSPLALRTSLADGPGFHEACLRIRQTVTDAFVHAELPFDHLVRAVRAQTSGVRHPLFNVLFNLVNQSMEPRPISNLTLEILPGGGERPFAPKFDLVLTLVDIGWKLGGAIEYSTGVLSEAMVSSLSRCFLNVLREGLHQPEVSYLELPLIDERLSANLLRDWSRCSTSFAEPSCIHELFESICDRLPHQPAIVHKGSSLSYQELDSAANRLAHYLQRKGLSPEKFAVCYMERGPALVVSILAILKAGGAFLVLDPRYHSQRFQEILDDACPAMAVTQRKFALELNWGEKPLAVLDADQASIEMESGSRPGKTALPANLACAIYTSGSTGKPKGVMCTHQGLQNVWLSSLEAFGLGPQDRLLQFASVTFDAFVWELLICWGAGATMVMAGWEHLAPGPDLPALLREPRITAIFMPPSALAAVPASSLPDLKTLIVGGEACPANLVEIWADGHNFYNAYGPSEISVWATYDLLRRGEVPHIGRPVLNAEVYILDRNMHPVPPGFRGEIFIGGAGMTRGYHGRPDLTAERFLPDPFSGREGARLYRSGDLGSYRPDGRIRFEGRIDDQVKVRGFRVEPAEIQGALEEHPDVQSACVASAKDPLGNLRFVAWVVPRPQAGIGFIKTLGLWSAKRLPSYMRPAAFVKLQIMPVSAQGKIDRHRLPAPDWRYQNSEDTAEPPQGPVEEMLARIWREVVGVESLSRHSNFFEIGGDSIQAIRVISRARRSGMELSQNDILEHPTLESLAQAARSATLPTLPGSDTGAATAKPALTPIMLWFLEHYGPLDRFCQSMLIQVPANLRKESLVAGLQALLDGHDSLRICLDRLQDWNLQIKPRGSILSESCLEIIDLDGLSQPAQVTKMKMAGQSAEERLNLKSGRVLQAVWFRREETGLLLLLVHHFAVDGVSWGIMVPDLAAACSAALAGEVPVLEPEGTPFLTWTKYLAEQAHASGIRQELTLWQNMLAGHQPLFPNTSVDRTRDTTLNAGQWTVALSAELSAALLALVPATLHAAINDVLLTALAAAVTEWRRLRSHEDSSVLFNLEGHGRETISDGIDLSRTVGWFTSLYPVRLDISHLNMHDALRGGPAIVSALRSVQEQMRAIPRHGIGYGLLRYLNRDAAGGLAGYPAPQIGFNYLGRFKTGGPGAWMLSDEEVDFGEETPMVLSHLIEVNAVALDYPEGPRFSATWKWSQSVPESDIRDMAALWQKALEAMLARVTQLEQHVTRQEQKFGSQNAVFAAPEPPTEFSLSPLQEGILFHVLKTPEQPLYIQQFNLKIRGEFRREGLEFAWQQILARHSALRTSFVWEGVDFPRQRIHPPSEPKLFFEDWRGLAPEEQERRWREFQKDDLRRGFSLKEAPLARCALFQVEDRLHYFTWTLHHIAVDGWSYALLSSELLRWYSIYRDRSAEILPPAPQYYDFIRWQIGRNQQAHKNYWPDKLRDFSEPALIATPSLRPRKQSNSDQEEVAYQELTISEKQHQRLQQFCRRNNLTLNTIFQAAWAFVLSRYTGLDDVLHGVTVSGRPAELAEVENIVGLFVNTLPLRVHFRYDQPMLAFLRELHRDLLDIQAHSFDSLAEIQRSSAVPAGLALFDSLLLLQNYPFLDAAGDSHAFEIEQAPEMERTDYALSILVAPGPDLHLRMIYDRGRLAKEWVEQFMFHLRHAVVAIPELEGRRLGDWTLLSRAEIDKIVYQWNRTEMVFPGPPLVHQWIERQATERPHAPALIFQGTSLSYAEMNARANKLAYWLRQQGCGPETIVGIHAERSLDLLIALLATLKAGAAFLTLPLDSPAARLAGMMAETKPMLLLTQRALQSRLPECSTPIVVLEDEPWSETPESDLQSHADPENIAYLLYTSGTSGKPKGVMNTHRGLRNRILWMQQAYPLHVDDCVLQKTSYSFDVSMWEFFWPLMFGARLAIAEPEKHRDRAYLAEVIFREGVTVLHFVPSMLQVFLEDADLIRRCSGTLRRVMCSGEALPASLRDLFMEHCNADLVNLYGPTEAAIDVTHWRCAANQSTVPIGTPIANARIYLLDSSGHPVPPGCPGELCITGIALARGYVAAPDLTAERFVPDPFSRGGAELLYRTGDLAWYRQDGVIEYLGRIDAQVKIRGQRVELEEIEEAIRSCPGVTHVAVASRTDGSGSNRLVAYLAAPSPDLRVVRQHLAARLPEYMVPSVFTAIPAIPLNANGKINRKALPSPAVAAITEFVPPRDELEAALAKLWAELTGARQVGIRDHFFFDLGGHSLLALRLLGRVKQRWAGSITLSEFLSHPTVEGMAQCLHGAAQKPNSLITLQSEGSAPPLYLVHPALGVSFVYHELARHLGKDQPVYAFQAACVDGGAPIPDVVSLARTYLESIPELRKQGPIVLAGYSYGGVVAFEMSRQLASEGRAPEALLILDTLPPSSSSQTSAEPDQIRMLLEIMVVYERYFGVQIGLSHDDLEKMAPEQRLSFLESKLQAAGIWETRESIPLRGTVAANKAAIESLSRYKPAAYHGPVHLVRCKAPLLEDVAGIDPAVLKDPSLGWQHWCSQNVMVHWMDGHHLSLMKTPVVAEIARVIQDVIMSSKAAGYR